MALFSCCTLVNSRVGEGLEYPANKVLQLLLNIMLIMQRICAPKIPQDFNGFSGGDTRHYLLILGLGHHFKRASSWGTGRACKLKKAEVSRPAGVRGLDPKILAYFYEKELLDNI